MNLLRAVLEDEPEHRTVGVIPVVEVQREARAVAYPVDRPGPSITDPDAEAIGIRLSRHRSAPPLRPRHRARASPVMACPRTPTRTADRGKCSTVAQARSGGARETRRYPRTPATSTSPC